MASDAKGADGSKARRADGGVEVSDATAEFEEYTAPPRLDEKGQPIPKSKGLNAAGYRFPPAGGPQPPLTKENLAKGIGVPPLDRKTPDPAWPVPPLPGKGTPPAPTTSAAGTPASTSRPSGPSQTPAAVKVYEDPLFEEYHRPDLKEHPRTGSGIRSDPTPAPSAKELLENYEPPIPEVLTPKRFGVMPTRKSAPGDRSQQEDAAHLDAVADALLASDAVMSNPVANGPMKTVVQHEDNDLFAPPPAVPAAQPGPSPLPASASAPPAAALPRPAAWGPSPSMTPSPAAPSSQVSAPQSIPYVPPPGAHPHAADVPPTGSGGAVPRIGLVQCDFHHTITTAMAVAAHSEASRLGAPVVHHLHVPGVFDSPLAAKTLLERDDVDAVVVIGCVVQGETGHDEVITHAAAQTLLALACNSGKPVGLGITGPRMTKAQAEARVASGAHAVASVVAQHRLLRTA